MNECPSSQFGNPNASETEMNWRIMLMQRYLMEASTYFMTKEMRVPSVVEVVEACRHTLSITHDMASHLLLRGALHPLRSLWHAVFVVLIHACCALSSPLSALVNLFEGKVIHHGIRWRFHARFSRREDILQHLNFLG